MNTKHMKIYSLRLIRLSTKNEVSRSFDTIDELYAFKTKVLLGLELDVRTRNESFQLVLKKHIDAAFNYEILESKIITKEV